MFLAVWSLYTADRLLDNRNRRPRTDHQPRHRFHHRHRLPFAFALCTASAALLTLVPTLPIPLLRAYLLLAALLLAWFSVVHLTTLRLPAFAGLGTKELAPGPFFAAATFLPALLARPSASLFLAAILFATLCTLNCILIHAWEHPATPRRTSPRALALTLIAAPLLLCTPIILAVALAAALLLLLDSIHPRLHPTTLRAAADLALLTPLCLLPFLT